MNWWRRKPSRPTDSDPDLADIRRDSVGKSGEDIAYAIRLTGKDQTPVGTPTWDPLSPDEAMEHIKGLLSERFSLRTRSGRGPGHRERPLDRVHDGPATLTTGGVIDRLHPLRRSNQNPAPDLP